MKLAYLLAAVAASALCLSACDMPGSTAKEEAKVTPAAAPPPSPPPPPADTPPVIPGLSQPYATEAEWVAACQAGPPAIPESVCTCVGKATVKEVGVEGLYDWAFKFLVNRDGQEKMRMDRWYTSKNLDSAAKQKLADAAGKCYVN